MPAHQLRHQGVGHPSSGAEREEEADGSRHGQLEEEGGAGVVEEVRVIDDEHELAVPRPLAQRGCHGAEHVERRAVAAHRDALKKAAFAAEELWKAANEMPSGDNKQANRERVEALARFAMRAEKLVYARAALEKANVFITDSIVLTCEAVLKEEV
jgi:hypothetical protein